VKIGGYEFDYVCEIEPFRSENGSVQSLLPMGRYRNARHLMLNRYGRGPFCKFRIPNTQHMSGVYGLLVGDELTFRYLGECVHLSNRFNAGYGNISPRNCFKGGQETNCRLNNLVFETTQAGKRVSLWFFRTADHKTVEKVLFGALQLNWNL
jgi:hypothetical protein